MEDHPRGRGRDTKLRHRRPLSRNQCSGTDDHHTTIREIGVKHAFVRCATAKWNPACTAIVEAANGPTTADADALLAEKKIEVFPDVCCNSGGVVVSCYEWLHNRSYEYWTEEDIQVRLKNASHVPNVNKINFIQGIQHADTKNSITSAVSVQFSPLTKVIHVEETISAEIAETKPAPSL